MPSFAFTLALLATVAARSPEPRLALAGLDPIALCADERLPGREEVTVTHGLFTYRFATEAARATFTADPDRYAIRFGGACGKMGPLTGPGEPDRYHVHDGRIYVFASESCRDAFRSAPESYIDRPDPVPAPTAAEAARGRALLDKAARGFGGTDALAALRSLATTIRASYPAKDTVHVAERVQWIELPGRLRYEERWSGRPYGHALGPAGAFQIARDEAWPAEPDVESVIRRRHHREPLVLVALRSDPALVARALADSVLGTDRVERVEVAVAGATSVLSLEPRTGRVLAIAYRDRTARGIRPIERRFSEFRPEGALVLPHGEREWREGVEQPSPRLELIRAEINVVIPPGTFTAEHAPASR